MIMCSQCHKRMAVIFITKLENGKKVSEGVCFKCAKDLGLPVDKMVGDTLGQLGVSTEDMESMEESLMNMVGELPSDIDDNEDGGAPAIDLPKLFGEGGILNKAVNDAPSSARAEDSAAKDSGDKKKSGDAPKKKKFLTT